jgi:hypothetical protein
VLGGHLQEKGLEAVALLADGNLVDAVWGDSRPALPDTPLRVHEVQWAGQSVQDKLQEVLAITAAAAAAAAGRGSTAVNGCPALVAGVMLRPSEPADDDVQQQLPINPTARMVKLLMLSARQSSWSELP